MIGQEPAWLNELLAPLDAFLGMSVSVVLTIGFALAPFIIFGVLIVPFLEMCARIAVASGNYFFPAWIKSENEVFGQPGWRRMNK